MVKTLNLKDIGRNLPNLRKSSRKSFAKSILFYAAAIYAAIELRTYLLPPDPRLVYTDEFIRSPQTTDKKGLYINDFRIPVEFLHPGKDISLPYDLVKDGNGNLRILVDDASLEVELYSRDGTSWTLESKVEPASKDKEGKDGLTLSGRIADEYRLTIKAPGNKYGIILKK